MPRQNIFFSDLATLEQQINQLFESTRHSNQPSRNSWSPAVDIYETTNSFVLTAEVPGVSSNEIDVKVVENQLTLRGERRWDREGTTETGVTQLLLIEARYVAIKAVEDLVQFRGAGVVNILDSELIAQHLSAHRLGQIGVVRIGKAKGLQRIWC